MDDKQLLKAEKNIDLNFDLNWQYDLMTQLIINYIITNYETWNLKKKKKYFQQLSISFSVTQWPYSLLWYTHNPKLWMLIARQGKNNLLVIKQ